MLMSQSPDESLTQAAVGLFGDPLRARIVRLLASEQMCTCHLIEQTGARQTTVSHHLRLLREAGLVETEPRGRYTYYRLRPEAIAAAAEGLGDLAAQAVEARDRYRPC
ncbi:ArsR/SmtB family transcription factor [Streptomonospora wellingtoniae]|uniref:Metalloregulator ArsR/SmtB family transcription factor n=1 Tax=Streptomonospora wellingtoniae TaxID=3075544 RepID=A0ABU2KMZ1_9ACTN|nr:metalloregulator ArsR/SmtB family transcription factor [Streptomonospora sp. DSM 45055]MDT0300635.1 metalloregulator ArsR/SmtB family transcription factor [Streptomonospora sp. DSM 45055]